MDRLINQDSPDFWTTNKPQYQKMCKMEVKLNSSIQYQWQQHHTSFYSSLLSNFNMYTEIMFHRLDFVHLCTGAVQAEPFLKYKIYEKFKNKRGNSDGKEENRTIPFLCSSCSDWIWADGIGASHTYNNICIDRLRWDKTCFHPLRPRICIRNLRMNN